MYLYLVRHTTPDVAPGMCYGQTDLDVARSFEAELMTLQAKLAHLSHATLFSSPLQRCKKLANAFTHLGKVQEDTRLMELNFGEWEMQPWENIPQGMIETWADDHVKKAPPNGESFLALAERAQDFFDELRQHSIEHAVVFTHAGVIRALLSSFLGMPLTHAFRLQVDYGHVTVLHCKEPAPALLKFNM